MFSGLVAVLFFMLDVALQMRQVYNIMSRLFLLNYVVYYVHVIHGWEFTYGIESHVPETVFNVFLHIIYISNIYRIEYWGMFGLLVMYNTYDCIFPIFLDFFSSRP